MHRKWKTAMAGVAACTGLFVYISTGVAQTPKPKRINRAIELLEQGQPIYYTGSHSGTVGSFEQGKADAQTWADYISYDMEAAPYDVAGLAAYMQGLAAGGPTRTGHKTPAVIVNVAVRGTDEATVRANFWMFEQVLATACTEFFSAMQLPLARCGRSSKRCAIPTANKGWAARDCKKAVAAHMAPPPHPRYGVSPMRSI
jgi:hypothetical protein